MKLFQLSINHHALSMFGRENTSTQTWNSTVDGDKGSATHTGRFTPGDETPETHSVWYCGLVSQSRFGVNIMPGPVGYLPWSYILSAYHYVAWYYYVSWDVSNHGCGRGEWYAGFDGKTERKRPTGRPRKKCQNNIEMEISRNMMRKLTWLIWLRMGASDGPSRSRWGDLQVPQNTKNFSTVCVIISFWRRTV